MSGYRVFITGVGGQGTLLASRILGEAALLDGIDVTVSEIHGMAQRGGVVESAVLLGGVKSPIISDGEADVLLGFEPLETYRALRKCSGKTLVISNITTIIPYSVTSGLVPRYPDVQSMMAEVRNSVGRLIAFDALELAGESGSPLAVNVVMLGVLAARGTLPISPGVIERAVLGSVKPQFREINIRAFRLGLDVEP